MSLYRYFLLIWLSFSAPIVRTMESFPEKPSSKYKKLDREKALVIYEKLAKYMGEVFTAISDGKTCEQKKLINKIILLQHELEFKDVPALFKRVIRDLMLPNISKQDTDALQFALVTMNFDLEYFEEEDRIAIFLDGRLLAVGHLDPSLERSAIFSARHVPLGRPM